MRISDWSSDVCSSDLNATHESSTASAVAPRFLSLRSSSPHSSRCARQGDELQLLVLPSLRRHLGLLRVRNGVDPGSSRKHGRLRLGRPDAEERALRNVRHHHPLGPAGIRTRRPARSEEHTSELQSLMRNSYAVFCLKKTTTYVL